MIALYLALLNGVDGKRTNIIDEIFSQDYSKNQSDDILYQENSELQIDKKTKTPFAKFEMICPIKKMMKNVHSKPLINDTI